MKNRSLEYFAVWTKCDGFMEQDHDWQRLIYEDYVVLLRLEITATEDQSPTPRLLVVWTKMTEDQAGCLLCRDNPELRRILSSCNSKCAPSALTKGEYTWWHDSYHPTGSVPANPHSQK